MLLPMKTNPTGAEGEFCAAAVQTPKNNSNADKMNECLLMIAIVFEIMEAKLRKVFRNPVPLLRINRISPARKSVMTERKPACGERKPTYLEQQSARADELPPYNIYRHTL